MIHIVLVTGIIVSLMVTEFTGYSPGGVVAVGYLAMFAHQPRWLAGTLAVALVTFGAVRILEQRLLLYGRRKFSVYLLVGIIISQFLYWLTMASGLEASLLVIGYLIPGLIARDFSRQGILTTMLVLTLAIVITRILLLVGGGVYWS